MSPEMSNDPMVLLVAGVVAVGFWLVGVVRAVRRG